MYIHYIFPSATSAGFFQNAFFQQQIEGVASKALKGEAHVRLGVDGADGAAPTWLVKFLWTLSRCYVGTGQNYC